jgi:hypothetical protein
MVRRLLVFALISTAAITAGIYMHASPPPRQVASSQSHGAWVIEILKRMQTIKPGMTREDLLKVFTPDGGLSNGLQRTYVSQDFYCFKVDVEFEPVGRPSRDAGGRVTLEEDAKDVIVKISKPYLEFPLAD